MGGCGSKEPPIPPPTPFPPGSCEPASFDPGVNLPEITLFTGRYLAPVTGLVDLFVESGGIITPCGYVTSFVTVAPDQPIFRTDQGTAGPRWECLIDCVALGSSTSEIPCPTPDPTGSYTINFVRSNGFGDLSIEFECPRTLECADGLTLTADTPTTSIANVAAFTNGFRFDIGVGPTEGTLRIRCRCCSEFRTDAREEGQDRMLV